MPRPYVSHTFRAPVPWHDNVIFASQKMEEDLKITHPILTALLKLWQIHFQVSSLVIVCLWYLLM